MQMNQTIIFAGTPENAAVTLRSLVASGFEVSLVITRPDAHLGRKRVLTPSPVAVAASELNLPILKTNNLDEPQINQIKATGSTCAIVVAFGALLRTPAIQALRGGWFNLHYSLLPRWRGAAPVAHAIAAGDRVTGVTLFRIDEGLDTGEVLAIVPTEIQPRETAGELLHRLTELGCSLLKQEVPKILSGQLITTPQDARAQVTYAPKLDRDFGRLDFHKPASELEQRIYAANPEPGAWTVLNDVIFKIHEAQASALLLGREIGAVIKNGDGVFVACNESSLKLLEVQPAGKPRMSAVDWANGLTYETSFK